MYKRLQNFHGLDHESAFLWGPRQTGKSTLLKALFSKAPYYDLLLAEEFERLKRKPGLFREEILASSVKGPIVVDEVQKIPELLNEIQWLMVNHGISFILCSSSARALKRKSGNLLGGRALHYELFPLVSKEIQNFDLLCALNHGLLPRHYLAEDPSRRIAAYVGDYLKEEIVAEATVRNIPAFTRFLETAALSNGEIVNYTNIARETGISSGTVKAYFQILVDTLLGRFIPSYRKRAKRRVIHAPKFYFFDVSIVNFLLRRGPILPKSELFGRAFEHFILQELLAHRHYSGRDYPITYWRSASGFEVDFILGDHEVALEVKGVEEVQAHHLRGLRAFKEDYAPKKSLVVSLDRHPRKMDTLLILPISIFLEKLWAGEIL